MSDTSPKNQDALCFNAPKVAPRQPTPGEPLFAFQRGAARLVCELRAHGVHGVEVQFLENGELLESRHFGPWLSNTQTPRELAIQWAETQRRRLEAR